MPRITLSGLSGTGKTEIAKAVAKELGCQVVSAGRYMREHASNAGLTIEAFAKQPKTKHQDRQVDDWIKQFNHHNDHVISEGRLTWRAVDNADLKVLLHCDINVRARRRANQQSKPHEMVLRLLNERDADDRDRFRKVYYIDDFTDPSNFHISVNTAVLTLEQCVKLIISAYKVAADTAPQECPVEQSV